MTASIKNNTAVATAATTATATTPLGAGAPNTAASSAASSSSALAMSFYPSSSSSSSSLMSPPRTPLSDPNKFHRQHHKLQQQQQQQDRLEYPRQFRSFHDQHQQHQQQQHQQNRDNDCFNALTEVFQSLEKRLMDTEDDKASVHRYMTYISRHNPRDVLERVFEIEEAQQRLRQQADCEISRMIRLGILDTGERPVPNWKKRGQNGVST